MKLPAAPGIEARTFPVAPAGAVHQSPASEIANVPSVASALAVVVLAHADSVQVRRLIDALDPFPVFLHCDVNTPDTVFAEMTTDLPERCVVLPRIRTGWARWENVAAELEGYRAALKLTDASHFALLSGADYPVASSEEIAATLQNYLGRTLAMFNDMPYPEWGRSGGLNRLRYRHWAFRKHMLRLPIPRRLPRGVSLTGGSQMKVIAREHAQSVVNAADNHPELVKFWKRSWVPDETFIPSILTTPTFVPGWKDEHLRYTPWLIMWDDYGQKSPPWLGMQHLETLAEWRVASESEIGVLFARKFSTEYSSELLDVIDAEYRQPPVAPGGIAMASVEEAIPHRDGHIATGPESLPTLVAPTSGAFDAGVSPSESSSVTTSQSGAGSGLFGRGFLYVIVWSLQLIAGTIVSPILAHLLGPEEFGGLASAIALYQLLSVLALLGLDQAVVLQRAEDGNDTASRGLVAVGIAISALVTIGVCIAAPLWSNALGFGYFSPLVLAVVLWTAPGAAVQIMLALLLAQDRLRAFSLVSALSAVGGQAVGLGLLFFVHRDATTYAWGGVFSQFGAMILGIILTRPQLRGLFNWAVTWRAIKLGIPLALGGLAYVVLNAGDRLVIQSVLGAAEVGRYQIAYVIGSVVILLLTFTSNAWTPRIAAVKDESERWALSATSRDSLFRLLIPVTIGATLAAPVALRVVAPASFRSESLLIVVFLVALAAFPVAASGATTRLLITLRRGRTIAVIAGIAAAVNFGLNLLFVPLLGIAGSALSTFLAYVLLALLQAKALPSSPAWRGPSLRLSAVMAGAIAFSAMTVALPQTSLLDTVRFGVGLCCLPWFVYALRQARRS